jgi:thiamine pyrophosphate-dependent acetolactate synthase large subunit-like protein
MPNKSWSGAEVRFLDYDQILADLRQAVREAKAAHPEIVKVLLFGSLVQGDWTADSDADLIVVVGREFPDFLSSRTPYQVFTRSIPTDSLVYSEAEFQELSCDPESFLARNLPTAIEL